MGLLIALASTGCQKASQGLSPAPPAAFVHNGRPHPAARQATEELPETAAIGQLQVEPNEPPRPAEAGAVSLVRSVASSVAGDSGAAADITLVTLQGIRNHSRCPAEEFDAFRQRLATLLTDAGRDEAVTFSTGDDEVAAYEMLGTAYLVTADGFDQWELYLRLCPAGETWTIWKPDGPLRVLRQPRPGRPQITRWGRVEP